MVSCLGHPGEKNIAYWMHENDLAKIHTIYQTFELLVILVCSSLCEVIK